jgi:hypothetical protein
MEKGDGTYGRIAIHFAGNFDRIEGNQRSFKVFTLWMISIVNSAKQWRKSVAYKVPPATT